MADRSVTSSSRAGPGGAEPPSPRQKWRAITLATLVIVPGYWSMLAGFVSSTVDDEDALVHPAAAFAFGLAVIPFAFVVLAFLSEHPRAPLAVVKALGLAVLVGVPVSALAADGVTGIVAGVGAGGICALRPDVASTWRSRALGVLAACVYTFVLVRAAAALALLPAPILPFTAVGLADHLAELRRERETEQG